VLVSCQDFYPDARNLKKTVKVKCDHGLRYKLLRKKAGMKKKRAVLLANTIEFCSRAFDHEDDSMGDFQNSRESWSKSLATPPANLVPRGGQESHQPACRLVR
jgi:hypothetical protein